MECDFVTNRELGIGKSLPQILPETVNILSEWLGTPPLRFAGNPPIQIEITESSIANQYAWIEKSQNSGVSKLFSLASHARNPQLILYAGKQLFPSITEKMTFDFSCSQEKSFLVIKTMPDVIARICCLFKSYNGHTTDIAFSLKTRKKQIKNPTFLPSLILPGNLSSPLPLEASNLLSDLLLEHQFDTRCVPAGVWWINYWDRVQIETIGRLRVRTAPWAKILEADDDSLVLVATDTPLDPENPFHYNQVAEIVRHLNLIDIQKKYRVAKL
jgi:hypothetical protein